VAAPPPPPPSGEPRELLSLADFDDFTDNEDASVIAAFTDKEIVDPKAVKPEGWDDDEDGEWSAPTIEHPVLETFKSISGSSYDYRFAFTSAPEVLEKLKCKKAGLFLYRSPKFLSKKDGDRPRERFPSDTLTESAVKNWLSAKAQPLVGLFSSSTKERYKGAVLVVFLNLDFEKNGQSVEYVLKRARKAAAALKKEGKPLAIAVARLSDMNYELADYGLTSTKPTADILMGLRVGSDYNFKYYSSATYFDEKGTSAAFSGKTLSAFADAYLAGELTPYVKPDEPPPADDEEPPADYDAEGEGEGAEDKEEM